MMNKTHLGGGILASSATLLYLQPHLPALTNWKTGIAICIATVLTSATSSLLPDIDHKRSSIGRKLWFLSWPIYLLQFIGKFLSFFAPKKYQNLRRTVGHRGFTHFPSTWFVLTAIAILTAYYIQKSGLNQYPLISACLYGILGGFSIGLLSHLILDFFSGKLKVFAPFSYKSYGMPIFKTNGFLENTLRPFLYLLSIKMIYTYIITIIHTLGK